MEALFASDLSGHLAAIARHWAKVAPYGDAATARKWLVRAADEAVRRLAYEEGLRLYRAALRLETTLLPDIERCRVLIALGRAAYFAGDLRGCVDAAVAATDAAHRAHSPELVGDVALVVEAAPDLSVNEVGKRLCEDALSAVGESGPSICGRGCSRNAATWRSTKGTRTALSH